MAGLLGRRVRSFGAGAAGVFVCAVALVISSLVVLSGPAQAAGPLLVRYPYLTDLTASSVDVVWVTSSADLSAGVVTYGTSGNCAASVATGTPLTSYTAFGDSTTRYYQHSVLLTNLAPSTSYCYRIYTGTSTPGAALLAEPRQFPTTFTTVPVAGSATPFSFDVLGDFGSTTLSNSTSETYNPYQAALDAQIAATTSAPNPALFAVSTGDIAYNDGSATNYGDLNHPADAITPAPQTSTIFDARYWGQVGSRLPLYSVTGNHGRNGTFFSTWPTETNRSNSTGVYGVSTPYPATDGVSAGNYPSDWYAFTVSGVRFYVLDADWSDVAQNGSLGSACPPSSASQLPGASYCPSYQVERDMHWQQSSLEYQWLVHDLAQDKAARGDSALRMAFFHYPLRVDQNNYTTQQDVYLQNSRANPNGGSSSLEALLASNNVNMAFNGHAHLYERNVAPLGGVPNYVTGGGGAVPSNVAPSAACSSTDVYARGWDPSHAVGSSCGTPTAGTAKPTAAAQVYHFLKVTVSGTDVSINPTDSTGAVFDPMTYHFAADSQAPTAPSPPTVVAGTGSSAGNVTLTLRQDATDNVGVVSYDIYRDSTYRATVPAGVPTWTDVAVPAGAHTWTVRARDQRGNSSPLPTPIFEENFESGSLSVGVWSSPTPGLVTEQATVHSGVWAAEETSTGAATWSSAQLPGSYRAVHASAWVYVKSRSTSAGFLKLRSATGGYIAYLYVNASGYLSVRNDAGNVTHVSTVPVTNGQWHKVDLYLDVNPGGPVTIAVALDGVSAPFTTPVGSTETLGASLVGQLVLGDTIASRSYDIAIDDITIDTQAP
jgi:hypothetical protein